MFKLALLCFLCSAVYTSNCRILSSFAGCCLPLGLFSSGQSSSIVSPTYSLFQCLFYYQSSFLNARLLLFICSLRNNLSKWDWDLVNQADVSFLLLLVIRFPGIIAPSLSLFFLPSSFLPFTLPPCLPQCSGILPGPRSNHIGSEGNFYFNTFITSVVQLFLECMLFFSIFILIPWE